MDIKWIYVLVMSLIAFLIMGVDKYKAIRHAWRIPEKTLWLVSIVGGAPGASLGMLVFHHKIRKPEFFIGFPLLAIAEIWFCAIMIG